MESEGQGRRPTEICPNFSSEMNGVWEGFCTLCICFPCGLKPRCPLTIISLISLLVGVVWVSLGVWLAVVVILNASLPLDQQIYFEKLQTRDSSHQPYFVNESSYVFTPVDNLKFYLLSMSTIAILGGLGRAIASISLIHYLHKKLVSGVVSLAWVILSLLSVVSLGILTVDTLYTLSHNDLTPPNNRDFYFKNDQNHSFYNLCHIFKWFILADFVVTCYFQWVVRWFHRSYPFSQSPLPTNS